MTDPIHMQAELNKLNERHALLEARLSHLKEMLKEDAFRMNLELRHAINFIMDSTLAEVFTSLRSIREYEDALEEKRARV